MAEEKDLRAYNLWQKIAHVQSTLGPIVKGKATQSGPKYNYVSAESLFAIVQKRFGDIGIVVVPSITGVAPLPGNTEINTYSFRFDVYNADNPTEFFLTNWQGQAPTRSDKGANAASTIAEKYFLLRLLLASDEKDPEQIADEERAQKATAWHARVDSARRAIGDGAPTEKQLKALRDVLAEGASLTPEVGTQYNIPDDQLWRQITVIQDYLRGK